MFIHHYFIRYFRTKKSPQFILIKYIAYLQARSIDYNEKTLTKHPISFHKFWQIDPIDVYQNWFEQNDQNMINSIFKKKLCQRKQCDVTNSKNDDIFKHSNKHIDL